MFCENLENEENYLIFISIKHFHKITSPQNG